MMNPNVDVYKNIMRNYPTGVTIITVLDEDNYPIGLTANSFTSVSIDPLMVLWCIDKGSSSYQIFKNSNKFAVNILSDSQKDMCNAFARGQVKDRFSGVGWNLSENDLPIIDDVFAVLECEKVNQIDAGDHLILIGQVIDLEKHNKSPMLYHNRTMGPVPDYTNI